MARKINTHHLCFAFISFFFLTTVAQAFPETIRNGYVNCTACHVSPSGGGALIDYGRNYSAEGLSTWSSADEESLFHGVIKRKKIPPWLSLGGDIRGAQVFIETKSQQSASWLYMQGDFEAAATLKKRLTFDASLGLMRSRAIDPFELKSRRFFIHYNLTDQLSIRAGRFLPAYGLNVAEHIVATRAPLGLNQGTETYNLEFNWITDSWSITATGIRGPADRPNTLQESAGAVQIGYAFKDTYKVGTSYWSGQTEQQGRQMAGIWAMLGFSENFYYLGELDTQWIQPRQTNDPNTQGLFTYHKIGYEAVRGLHLLGSLEFWQADLATGSTGNDRVGLGASWYPRPHFDFQAMWTKWRPRYADQYIQDFAWLQTHYYF